VARADPSGADTHRIFTATGALPGERDRKLVSKDAFWYSTMLFGYSEIEIRYSEMPFGYSEIKNRYSETLFGSWKMEKASGSLGFGSSTTKIPQLSQAEAAGEVLTESLI